MNNKISRTKIEILELCGTIAISVAIILIVYFSTITRAPKETMSIEDSQATDHDGNYLNEKLLSVASDLIKSNFPNADVPNLISFGYENSKFSYTCFVSDEKDKIAKISFENDLENIDKTLEYICKTPLFSSNSENFTVSYYSKIETNHAILNEIKLQENIDSNYVFDFYQTNDLDETKMMSITYQSGSDYKTVLNFKYELNDISELSPISSNKNTNSYLYKLLYNVCA